MAKLGVFGFAVLPTIFLILAVASVILFRRNEPSPFAAIVALVAGGCSVLLALLMQLVTGGDQGISWWFMLPVFFFVLGIAIFISKRFSALWLRAIYLLTFLSAASTAIGIGYVAVTEMKTKRTEHRKGGYIEGRPRRRKPFWSALSPEGWR